MSGTWLGGLGLGQYETAFRDNQIDADTLPTRPIAFLRTSVFRSGTG